MLPLHNAIQHYAWGSPTAIPALLGRPGAESGQPWAEMWMGAHASAPSRVKLAADGELGLDELAAARPHEILGPRVAAAFGGRLPFLFKVIAAARPLSIQCHPDAASARAGFERENRLGVPLGARERNYRDASHKPELLVALGRFEALVGFRPPREIRERLDAAGARELAGERAGLEEPGGLARFLAALLRLGPDARRALLDEVAAGLTAARDRGPEVIWVERLMRDYPGDAAALAPLFLNYVELAADQGIFLEAGVLHAYLGGVGLELMASSDNVLRGGLTDKHIDVAELLAIGRFEPTRPALLEPAPAGGGLSIYHAPASEFRLGFVDLTDGADGHDRRRGEGRGPEIVLSFAERCRLVDDASGQELRLERGSAAFITAQVAGYRIDGQGGRVYVAEVP